MQLKIEINTREHFTDDIHVILKQGVEYDNEKAWEVVRKVLVEKM